MDWVAVKINNGYLIVIKIWIGLDDAVTIRLEDVFNPLCGRQYINP